MRELLRPVYDALSAIPLIGPDPSKYVLLYFLKGSGGMGQKGEKGDKGDPGFRTMKDIQEEILKVLGGTTGQLGSADDPSLKGGNFSGTYIIKVCVAPFL